VSSEVLRHLAMGWQTSVLPDRPYPGLGWVRAQDTLIHGLVNFCFVTILLFHFTVHIVLVCVSALMMEGNVRKDSILSYWYKYGV
jgi:hypothetical protein